MWMGLVTGVEARRGDLYVRVPKLTLIFPLFPTIPIRPSFGLYYELSSRVMSAVGFVTTELVDGFVRRAVLGGSYVKNYYEVYGYKVMVGKAVLLNTERNVRGYNYNFKDVKEKPPRWHQAAWACLGVLVGPVWAVLAGLVGVFRPKTKRFSSTATDREVEAFTMSTGAKSYDGVVIDRNAVITGRTLELLGRCFWLKRISITNCPNMNGRRVRAASQCECRVDCCDGRGHIMRMWPHQAALQRSTKIFHVDIYALMIYDYRQPRQPQGLHAADIGRLQRLRADAR